MRRRGSRASARRDTGLPVWGGPARRTGAGAGRLSGARRSGRATSGGGRRGGRRRGTADAGDREEARQGHSPLPDRRRERRLGLSSDIREGMSALLSGMGGLPASREPILDGPRVGDPPTRGSACPRRRNPHARDIFRSTRYPPSYRWPGGRRSRPLRSNRLGELVSRLTHCRFEMRSICQREDPQLSPRAFDQSGRRDSNPRPPEPHFGRNQGRFREKVVISRRLPRSGRHR